MDRIKALLGEAQRYYGQLSRREQLALVAAAACAVVFVFSLVLTTMSHSISHHEIAIDEKTGELQRVAIYAQSYAEQQQQRQAMELKLGGQPVRLMSQLQKFAESNGLTITAMNDRGTQNLKQVKESLVELQIATAPVDKLTALLDDIEHDPRIIKVRKLRLHQTAADTKALNVTMTVGTYQLLSKS